MDLRELQDIDSEDMKRIEMREHRNKVLEDKTAEEYVKELEILKEQYCAE